MHRVKWATPAPQWPSIAAIANAGSRATALQRPMLLRFATDAFMQELAAILDDDPERLKEIEARAGETWREYPGVPSLPAAGATQLSTTERRKLGVRFKTSKEGLAQEAGKPAPKKGGVPPVEPPAIKLFQPSHQRYYLVAASLVCGFPGLPDHRVDAAKQDRVTFVVRRLVPKDPKATTFDPDPAKVDEYAFVTGEDGSAWVLAPQSGALPALAPGEEKLPMFGSPFVGADGVSRRLFTGLVPVSRREVYMGTPQRLTPPSPLSEDDAAVMGAFPEPVDARVELLINDVIQPWRDLRSEAGKLNVRMRDAAPDSANGKKDQQKLVLQMRDRVLQTSWFLLLDFAAFLRRYLPEVSEAIDKKLPSGLTTQAEKALYTALTTVAYEVEDATGARQKTTLAEVLAEFDSAANRELLEHGPTLLTQDEDIREQFAGLPRFAFAAIKWPNNHEAEDPEIVRSDEWLTFGVDDDKDNVEKTLNQIAVDKMAGKTAAPTAIKNAVEAVLKERAPDASVPPPPPSAHGMIPANRTTRFVLRCVFDRPYCGTAAPSIISGPTEPFAMAPFFDPDAPMRQVRIAMPIDTSPAGLRKFQKNAQFLISDVLCGQMGATRKLTLGDLVLYVLPWPFHKDLPKPEVKPCANGIGMICSLSIPIVTICAMILLIIIVTILDRFFHWLPWLITCFPFPLKAKEQA